MVLNIAGKLARKTKGYWTEEELASFGYNGLADAIRKFDPAKGNWIGYAALRIRGAILDGMSLKHWHSIARGRKMPVSAKPMPLFLDTLDELRSLLLPLKPRTRLMLRLMYLDGLKSVEVAKLLGVSEALVSRQHKAALRLLRSQSSGVIGA